MRLVLSTNRFEVVNLMTNGRIKPLRIGMRSHREILGYTSTLHDTKQT